MRPRAADIDPLRTRKTVVERCTKYRGTRPSRRHCRLGQSLRRPSPRSRVWQSDFYRAACRDRGGLRNSDALKVERLVGVCDSGLANNPMLAARLSKQE